MIKTQSRPFLDSISSLVLRLLLSSITFYHKIVSPLLHQALGVQRICRYEESCSLYAGRVIRQYGILYGSQLAIKRLLACQPFHN